MFWGLIMEPQRRYTQKVTKAFHISMAALDISSASTEPSQVMCSYEGRNYLLCTLRKPDVLQCVLDLNFDVGNYVSFAANGNCNVHLTGYLQDEFNDLEDEEDDDDQEVLPVKQKKRKTNSDEPPSKKIKNGPVSSSQEAEGDSEDDYRNAILGESLDDDEDDSDAVVEEDAEEEESDEEEEENDGDEDNEEDAEEEAEEEEEDEDVSTDEEEEAAQEATTRKLNGGIPVKAESQKKKGKQLEESKKSPKVKNEQKNEVKTPNKEKQTPKKKSLQGGVIIEDIKEGQGAPAKNGKFVSVYYEGRLKQNNKLFDSTTKGAGFSFRLGNGEVIKGWDIGVAGMKIGGKRKIICPPAMAYGQKGSPPAIPPNSTLVFEVELKKVH